MQYTTPKLQIWRRFFSGIVLDFAAKKRDKFSASELGPKVKAHMFVDELSTKDSLVRMVRRMTANAALREDLLQEALIHLWLTEARRPGQTRSWYLQSCKYHLLHYLASGRSVDSGKRRAGQLHPAHDTEHAEPFLEEMDSGNSVFTWVSARDIIALLSPQLLPQEKAVLHCFADGLGPREIGRKLKMSHTMVIKHRRKIASLFNRLELPAARRPHTNGVNGTRRHEAEPGLSGRKAAIVQYPGLPTGTNGHRHATAHVRTNGHENGSNGNTKGRLHRNGHTNGYNNGHSHSRGAAARVFHARRQPLS